VRVLTVISTNPVDVHQTLVAVRQIDSERSKPTGFPSAILRAGKDKSTLVIHIHAIRQIGYAHQLRFKDVHARGDGECEVPRDVDLYSDFGREAVSLL